MRRSLTVLGLLGALGGCAGLADPFVREGTWTPTHINDDNLRAMVVNPVDLQHGTGATDSIGVTSAAAVTRLRTDNVKALPEGTVTGIAPGAGSGGQGGGGGGGGGGAAQ
jgi:hypothetical protein